MNPNPLALFWEGFTIESYAKFYAQSLPIRLQLVQGHLPCCSGCNQNMPEIYASARDTFEKAIFSNTASGRTYQFADFVSRLVT